MARRTHNEGDWDDSDDDWSAENDEDDDANSADDGPIEYGADDEECTMPCPYCQAEIHDEALRCPHCENYLSTEDAPSQRRPLWIVIGIIICLILVLIWIWP